MTALWTLLCGTCPLDVTRDMLQEKLQIVVAMYKDVKVVNGTLTTGKRGLSVLKKTNERRSNLNRFIELSSELDAWRRCARILAFRFEICDKVVLRVVLEILSAAKLRTFCRQYSYKKIRSIRALVVAAGHSFADTADCWSLWRQMSVHVRDAVKSNGLWHYDDAVRFRDAMAATLKESYTFVDIICFICLQKNL